ncbi:MAG: ribonuclease III domain-containing protein [Bacillota bacterium]|nr:ribonuclease III domain-containing protein [Bacillota bacterium]
MERLLNKPCNIKDYSPKSLAFIGDGVFDLLVRELLVCEANCPLSVLNKQKVNMVCCKAQAESYLKISSLLTEEEETVYKRGRNANIIKPKNASLADYHSATGLECLFGYLYLTDRIERIRELFKVISE